MSIGLSFMFALIYSKLEDIRKQKRGSINQKKIDTPPLNWVVWNILDYGNYSFNGICK